MNQVLYHGSKTQGLKTLKPFPHKGVDGESVVFATPDIRFALAMIHGTGDELAVGYFVDQETHAEQMYIDELVPGAFKVLSAPGIVYELEETGFVSDSRLSHLEMISREDTLVLKEHRYGDILEELKKHDIDFVSYEKVIEHMKKRGKDPKKPNVPYKPNRFT